MRKNAHQGENKPKVIYKILVLCALFFFINPVASSVDVLPDFIGCLLLFYGITRISYFDSKIENARKLILYLLAAEFIKLILTPTFLSTKISSNVMLATTAFSVIEAILYIRIITDISSGLESFCVLGGYNKTYPKIADIKVFTLVAFFIRIAATLIPDLIAIAEVEIQEADKEHSELLYGLIEAKSLIVVLMLFIAAIALTLWFISAIRFILCFSAEATKDIEQRYYREYTSQPEKVFLKRSRIFTVTAALGSLFSLDITFDGIRVLPFSVMFLLFAVLPYVLRGNIYLKKLKIFAPGAFILGGAYETYEYFFVVKNPVVIYETPLKTVVITAVSVIASAVSGLICIRLILNSLKSLREERGLNPKGTGITWISFTVATALKAVGAAVPYLYGYTSTPRIIFTLVFVLTFIKALSDFSDDAKEHISLYGGEELHKKTK